MRVNAEKPPCQCAAPCRLWSTAKRSRPEDGGSGLEEKTNLGLGQTLRHHICPDFFVVDLVSAVRGVATHGAGPCSLVEALLDVLGRQPQLAVDALEGLGRLHRKKVIDGRRGRGGRIGRLSLLGFDLHAPEEVGGGCSGFSASLLGFSDEGHSQLCDPSDRGVANSRPRFGSATTALCPTLQETP